MIIVRRSIGFGAIVLSALGLLLCLAGIVGVWMVKGCVEAVGNAVFAAADDSLGVREREDGSGEKGVGQ